MGTDPPPQPDLEIKVVTPRRGENAVHPDGTTPTTTRPPTRRTTSTTTSVAASSSSPTSSILPRQRRGSGEFRPFKQYMTWLMPGFVAVNVVLFIVTMYINDCPKYNGSHCVADFLGRFSFQPLKENPLLGASAATLEKMGALVVDMVVKRKQTWRLLTCMWLHAGVFHVLANMLSLLFIGIRLEQEFGFLRIGLLYVIAGFGGSLLSALFIQEGISVGASGALFGLLGAMLSELITNWTIYANKLAAFLTLILIVVINLAVGILPHVDNFAHLGGFSSGFLLGFVFLLRPQFGWVSQRNAPLGSITASVKSKHKTYQYVLWVVSAILLITGVFNSDTFTLGLVMLLRGVNMNEHCSWCHYLSCVPTPWWSCKKKQMYCESTQSGNQLNLTCVSNGKSNIYPFSGNDPPRLQQLCLQLCNL